MAIAHYGSYLGGLTPTPGVERVAPRPMDRPRGSVQQTCLAVLDVPRTVAELATVLGWDYDRAKSWVHRLQRVGRVERVGWVRTVKQGQRAGQYRRVGA